MKITISNNGDVWFANIMDGGRIVKGAKGSKEWIYSNAERWQSNMDVRLFTSKNDRDMLFSILCFFCFLVEVLGEKHGR